MGETRTKKVSTSIIKDALILFIITLVAGFLLGFVQSITSEPIKEQKLISKNNAYKAVFQGAENFEESEKINQLVEDSVDILASSGNAYGSIEINEAVEAKDNSGQVKGYIITSTSKDGYGGDITIATGIDKSGVITGIEMLEISETAGLGMKAEDEAFKEQYKGKEVESFIVTKSGSSSDEEIEAISGATITTDAVTNAVNAALYFTTDCIGKQGE